MRYCLTVLAVLYFVFSSKADFVFDCQPSNCCWQPAPICCQQQPIFICQPCEPIIICQQEEEEELPKISSGGGGYGLLPGDYLQTGHTAYFGPLFPLFIFPSGGGFNFLDGGIGGGGFGGGGYGSSEHNPFPINTNNPNNPGNPNNSIPNPSDRCHHHDHECHHQHHHHHPMPEPSGFILMILGILALIGGWVLHRGGKASICY